MLNRRPPEKLDAQVIGMQRSPPFQFLASLLRVRRGWFANHALQRRPSRSGSNRGVSWAGSQSLGR